MASRQRNSVRILSSRERGSQSFGSQRLLQLLVEEKVRWMKWQSQVLCLLGCVRLAGRPVWGCLIQMCRTLDLSQHFCLLSGSCIFNHTMINRCERTVKGKPTCLCSVNFSLFFLPVTNDFSGLPAGSLWVPNPVKDWSWCAESRKNEQMIFKNQTRMQAVWDVVHQFIPQFVHPDSVTLWSSNLPDSEPAVSLPPLSPPHRGCALVLLWMYLWNYRDLFRINVQFLCRSCSLQAVGGNEDGEFTYNPDLSETSPSFIQTVVIK